MFSLQISCIQYEYEGLKIENLSFIFLKIMK